MTDWRDDRIGSAERGENPTVLARMRSGFAVIGDWQCLPGYCFLLACPEVNHLTDLSFEQRAIYLQDMTLIGEAIMEVCQPRRVNYEILGNTDAYLHVHICPRYEWEPDKFRGSPFWLYPHEQFYHPNAAYSEAKHGDLKRRLSEALLARMQAYDALPH